jgi:hypothetical protein
MTKEVFGIGAMSWMTESAQTDLSRVPHLAMAIKNTNNDRV